MYKECKNMVIAEQIINIQISIFLLKVVITFIFSVSISLFKDNICLIVKKFSIINVIFKLTI